MIFYYRWMKKLMKKNNPDAFILMGNRYKQGEGVIQSDTKALEMFICSAELGHADAYSAIGIWYQGLGTVLERDLSKALEYYENQEPTSKELLT